MVIDTKEEKSVYCDICGNKIESAKPSNHQIWLNHTTGHHSHFECIDDTGIESDLFGLREM